MNEVQTRIIDDLAGLLEGELRCDPLTTAMYSVDGSLYQITPLGVAYPKQKDDVLTLVKYCAEMRIPMIPRGSGTGLSGESLGSGLVFDFSRHMRSIESYQGEDHVQVQPGVVLDRLNHTLKAFGRYFPPDPSSSAVTTIGSMISLDAAGSHAIRVGSTRDHLRSLELVLSDGNVFEAGTETLSQIGDGTTDQAKHNIVSRLSKILRENEPLIQEWQPHLPRNRGGYYLRGVLGENLINLSRMLVGSEGTLGIFTSASLHTSPIPEYRGVALLLFGQLESAVQAVQLVVTHQPSACDLIDRRILSLARELDPRFEKLISASAEAALIVEQTGFSDIQTRDRIDQIKKHLQGSGCPVILAHEAYTEEDVEFLWSLPKTVVPMLTRLPGRARPLPFVEDIAVPPGVLADFLPRAQNVFKRFQVVATLYAHAASGQLHFRPIMPPPGPGDACRLEELARELYQEVFEVGGTISGEHGTGLAKSGFLEQQYGPLYQVFREIKELFDPHNLMNPGKVIVDDPHLIVRNLRPQTTSFLQKELTTVSERPIQLTWSPEIIVEHVDRCNGCGHCRTQSQAVRMCPVFRDEPQEAASPRAKAQLLRGYLSGQIDSETFASPEMKKVASLCYNCKQCQQECPSQINIPHLVLEAKAAYVAAHGLRRSEWWLARMDLLGKLGCWFPALANWGMSNRTIRWLMEKLIGLSRFRKVPRFTRKTFMTLASRMGLTRRPSEGWNNCVVYFVDYFVNYHDPQLGVALVQILRSLGYTVHVPPGQRPSGMGLISAGDLEAGREIANQNLTILGEFARDRVPIVCTEPAAALCLKQEYPAISTHPDAEVVSKQVLEAGTFLAQELDREDLSSKFKSLGEFSVGYHTPCHLKALQGGESFASLLDLIPDLKLYRIDKGCSGMAGTFGFAAETFEQSMRIGAGLIDRMTQPDLYSGSTECSGCRIQMEHKSKLETIHPVKLLAMSLGVCTPQELKIQLPDKGGK